jgi:hypothetical protein
MSDFSTLYKKYKSVSNLTDDLNKSVITLKRRRLSSLKENEEQQSRLQVSEEEVKKANELIKSILTLLENFYNQQETSNELYELMDNSFFQNQILKNVVFKEEIIRVLNKVRENQNLTQKDLANIDKFISILDNEASILFKKLRTSRG